MDSSLKKYFGLRTRYFLREFGVKGERKEKKLTLIGYSNGLPIKIGNCQKNRQLFSNLSVRKFTIKRIKLNLLLVTKLSKNRPFGKEIAYKIRIVALTFELGFYNLEV